MKNDNVKLNKINRFSLVDAVLIDSTLLMFGFEYMYEQLYGQLLDSKPLIELTKNEICPFFLEGDKSGYDIFTIYNEKKRFIAGNVRQDKAFKFIENVKLYKYMLRKYTTNNKNNSSYMKDVLKICLEKLYEGQLPITFSLDGQNVSMLINGEDTFPVKRLYTVKNDNPTTVFYTEIENIKDKDNLIKKYK